METASPAGDYNASLLKVLEDERFNFEKEVRRLRGLGGEASLDDFRALLLATRDVFERLVRQHIGQAEAAPVITLGELAGSYWKQIDERKEAAPTGLGDLDKALGGGIQSGRLIALLGAPGSGKTTLANQIAEHLAFAGRPVLYVTSEDPPATLLAKTAARLGDIDYSVVLRGDKSARGKIDQALAEVYDRPSADRLAYLHDMGSLTLEAIKEQARAHFKRFSQQDQGGGSGLLVVDYLQRLARSLRMGGWQGIELREAVTRLTELLRGVAIELDCTILALASQNRGGYNGGNALASAKESGDVEYTCDVVLALSEDTTSKRKTALGHKTYSLYLAKNRLGPSGETLELDWYGSRQVFTGVKP